jgi:hypothetical protein
MLDTGKKEIWVRCPMTKRLPTIFNQGGSLFMIIFPSGIGDENGNKSI